MVVHAERVCSTLDSTGLSEYPDGDCGMPEWGARSPNFSIFGFPSQTFFDRHITTTEDGYRLSLIRLADTQTDGDVSGPFTGMGSKGPVLLLHGIALDATVWAQGIAQIF